MFKRVQSAGHFLIFCGLTSLLCSPVHRANAQTWTLSSAPIAGWACVCVSPDGGEAVAGNRGGYVYSSGDFGNSWNSMNPGDPDLWAWGAVGRAPENGQLYAAGSGGPIYRLTNIWFQTAAPVTTWASLICFGDGRQVVASIGVYQTGGIYVSSDFGDDWFQSDAPDQFWTGLAASSDAARMVATAKNGGIYVSGDLGFAWTQTKAPNAYWTSIASSANGLNFAATQYGGGIYTSTDAGGTWMKSRAPILNWTSIASSGDGAKLAATVNGDRIYTSTNSGATWQATASPLQNWSAIASSADGTKLVAVVNNGGIYTYDSLANTPPPPPQLSLSVSGVRGTLFWPTYANGYVLQSNADLSTTNWVKVAIPPTTANGQYQVIVSLPNGKVFYRLHIP